MKNREYWNSKIIEWEDSTKGENVSFIEKFASLFRKPLKVRAEMCIDILSKFIISDQTILELGCGSGYFAFNLYNSVNPKHIIGMDISCNAINRAKKISYDNGLSDKFTFIEADVNHIELPYSDITIGLGFLDYLSSNEITTLFKKIRSDYFLFTFSENRPSLIRYLHMLYLMSQRCSVHSYYSRDEIVKLIGDGHGDTKILSNKRLSFGCIIHNLPI